MLCISDILLCIDQIEARSRKSMVRSRRMDFFYGLVRRRERHRMKRHFRLLEALGLAIALIAWALDWWLVQDASQTIASLKARFVELQSADLNQQTAAKIKSEGSFTRAIIIQQLQHADLLTQYRINWSNPESRLAWLDSSRWTLTYYQQLFEVLDDVSQKHSIALSDEHKQRQERFNTFRAVFAKRYENANVDGRAVIPPPTSVATPEEIKKVRLFVQELHTQLPSQMNLIWRQLRQRADDRSRLYRILFAFGAILAVISKLFEWWYARTDA